MVQDTTKRSHWEMTPSLRDQSPWLPTGCLCTHHPRPDQLLWQAVDGPQVSCPVSQAYKEPILQRGLAGLRGSCLGSWAGCQGRHAPLCPEAGAAHLASPERGACPAQPPERAPSKPDL